MSCLASSTTDSGGAVARVGAAMAARGKDRARTDKRNHMTKRGVCGVSVVLCLTRAE